METRVKRTTSPHPPTAQIVGGTVEKDGGDGERRGSVKEKSVMCVRDQEGKMEEEDGVSTRLATTLWVTPSPLRRLSVNDGP